MGFPSVNPSPSIHTGAFGIFKNTEAKGRGANFEPWNDFANGRVNFCSFSAGEEENRMNFDKSMAQTMASSGTKSASTATSPCVADQKTAEALRGFLQDMARTIQSLSNRYKILAQSYGDVRSSVPLGIPSISTGVTSVPATQSSWREMNSVQVVTQNYHHVLSGVPVMQNHRQKASFVETQDWIPQGWTTEMRAHARCNGALEEGNARIARREDQARTNFYNHHLDSNIVDAMRGFLEDIKKTIHAWSTRHKFLLQGNGISAREVAEITGATPPASCFAMTSTEMPDLMTCGVPFNSCVFSTSANRGSFLQLYPQKLVDDQVMRYPNHGGTVTIELREPCHAEATPTTPLSQPEARPPADHEVTTDYFMQQERRKGHWIHGCRPGCEEEVVELSQSKGGKGNEGFYHSTEGTVVPSEPQLDHEGMDVELTPKNDAGEGKVLLMLESGHEGSQSVNLPDSIPEDSVAEIATVAEVATVGNGNASTAPDATAEVAAEGNCGAIIVQQATAPSWQRIVTVVESPDWLPKGWITEIKIRGSGHSAGAKDKYYFDPVSKRRFRSKKEVFCFLKTGKLGRYKPRPKIKSAKEILGTDWQSVVQLCTVRRSLSGRQTGRASSSSSKAALNIPAALCPSAVSSSASGHLSNVFIPYRPGQPSDLLVYESLVSVPVPVLDHFSHPDHSTSKINGYRRPLNGHWLFNSDGLWRPLLDRSEVFKADGREKNNDKGVTNPECSGGGMHAAETVQKHSAAGFGYTTAAGDYLNGYCASQVVTGQTMWTSLNERLKLMTGQDLSYNFESQPDLNRIPWPTQNKLEGFYQSLRGSSQRRKGTLKFQYRKFKRMKPQGKELLEALGRKLCQNGVSRLQG